MLSSRRNQTTKMGVSFCHGSPLSFKTFQKRGTNRRCSSRGNRWPWYMIKPPGKPAPSIFLAKQPKRTLMVPTPKKFTPPTPPHLEGQHLPGPRPRRPNPPAPEPQRPPPAPETPETPARPRAARRQRRHPTGARPKRNQQEVPELGRRFSTAESSGAARIATKAPPTGSDGWSHQEEWESTPSVHSLPPKKKKGNNSPLGGHG